MELMARFPAERARVEFLRKVRSALQGRPGLFLTGLIDADESYVCAEQRVVVQGDSARAAKILRWSQVVFSKFNGWLCGGFHGVSRKHLLQHLREFVYRTNRRRLGHDLFFYIPRRAVKRKPLPWARLAAEATAWAEIGVLHETSRCITKISLDHGV